MRLLTVASRLGVTRISSTELREDDYFHNRQVVGLGDIRHLI